MRYTLIVCAACCAGCASFRPPQPTWSSAPVQGQPAGGLTPNGSFDSNTLGGSNSGSLGGLGVDPANPGSGYTTGRPVGPAPFNQDTTSDEQLPSTRVRQRPQSPSTGNENGNGNGSVPYQSNPRDPLYLPPLNRTPADIEPTTSQNAPRIPNPNAWLGGPSHLAQNSRAPVGTARSRSGGDVTVSHQAGAVTGAGSQTATWRQVSRSSGGRPLEMIQLGRGTRHIVIMGSLIGNERESVAFVTALADLLNREPQRMGDHSIVLIRTPNPDGYADATLTNSRGVALNRNFPSRSFFGQRTSETGLTEASEPETQAIVHLCDDFRPDRIVHIRTGNASRPIVLGNTRAVQGLRERTDREFVSVSEFETFKAGSVEEYGTEALQAEVLLLTLPGGVAGWQNELPRFTQILIGPPQSSIRAASQSPAETPAVVGNGGGANSSASQTRPAGTSSTEQRANGQRQPEPPDLFAPYTPPASRTPVVESAAVTEKPGKRGFVELLPPPPEFAESPKGTDQRFYALPPPTE